MYIKVERERVREKIMGRSPCCSKEGLNRGAWTAAEDKMLTEYVKIHGEGRWRNLPKRAGLSLSLSHLSLYTLAYSLVLFSVSVSWKLIGLTVFRNNFGKFSKKRTHFWKNLRKICIETLEKYYFFKNEYNEWFCFQK